jgi:hypothetical protein
MTRVANDFESIMKWIVRCIDWYEIGYAVKLGLDKESKFDHVVLSGCCRVVVGLEKFLDDLRRDLSGSTIHTPNQGLMHLDRKGIRYLCRWS